MVISWKKICNLSQLILQYWIYIKLGVAVIEVYCWVEFCYKTLTYQVNELLYKMLSY